MLHPKKVKLNKPRNSRTGKMSPGRFISTPDEGTEATEVALVINADGSLSRKTGRFMTDKK